jgi:hypothetical protein
VLAALGVEGVLAHADELEPLGGFYAAALPAAIFLPPLIGLAGLVLILAALVGVETMRYAQTRRSLRNP